MKEVVFSYVGSVIGSANGFWFEEHGECIRHAAFTQSGHALACGLIRIECKSYHLRETEIRIFPFFLRLVLGKVISIPFLLLTNDVSELIEGNQILLNLFEQRKQMDANNPSAFKNTIYECGVQIRNNMGYEERLQLLSFLAKIAQSDGNVCKEEIEALKEVASAMGMSAQEVESMLNLGGKTLDEAYKVLEIEPTATDEEVKKAYRKMALKHHPDRVATLGDDVKKAAEEKFQQINNAKEMIFKARGLK